MLPLVVTVTSSAPSRERTLAFAESPVFVGRGPLNELQLSEPWIARTEGVLEFGDDSLHYTRQSTRNRVTVDGRELTTSDPVTVAGRITVGTLTLTCARRPVSADLLWRGAPLDESSACAQRAETVVLGALARNADEPLPLPPRAPALDGWDPGGEPASQVRRQIMLAIGGGEEPVPAGMSAPAQLSGHDVAEAPVSSVREGSYPPPSSAPPYGAPYSSSFPPASGEQSADAGARYEAYRAAWAELCATLKRQLEDTPEPARAHVAHDMQRSYPQIMREPEFRDFLKQLGLRPRRPADPDLEAWLHRIESVLPTGVKLQSGFTVERLLEIVEGYTSAFVDLNDAQEEVRRRSFGKPKTGSLLQKSDDPSLILAYLLNPEASWSSRAAELQAVIKAMVRHEWALMQATLEGARELLESVSPAELARQQGVELPASDEPRAKGFWHPLGPSNGTLLAAQLWFRFVDEHAALTQGDHYQRRFLGARFSKRYTKAMGTSDSTTPRHDVRPPSHRPPPR